MFLEARSKGVCQLLVLFRVAQGQTDEGTGSAVSRQPLRSLMWLQLLLLWGPLPTVSCIGDSFKSGPVEVTDKSRIALKPPENESKPSASACRRSPGQGTKGTPTSANFRSTTHSFTRPVFPEGLSGQTPRLRHLPGRRCVTMRHVTGLGQLSGRASLKEGHSG